MQTTLTEAGKFERLLTVQLDESELEPAKDAAARKLSRELKIKGFRPGKAPRPIVEKFVGSDALRGEAIEDGVPDLVNPALQDLDLEPVTAPRIKDIRDRDEGGIEVDIVITLWPTVDAIPELARSIQVDVPEVTDEEIEAQIDRLRSQYAELEDVSRPADNGDYVLINLSAIKDGAAVEAVNADDLLYEVGSASYIPGLDDMLMSASAGDIREGPATLPEGFDEDAGSEVTLRALVKQVRAKKLPEVTDDWVSDVSEFDDVASLRSRLETNLAAMKKNAASGVYREQLLEAIVEELDVDLPDGLIEAEMDSTLHNMAHSLEQQGLDLATYFQITGQDQKEFVDEVRVGAIRSLKTRILLEGVVKKNEFELGDDELDEVLAEMATSTETSVDDVRSVLTANGQLSVLTGDILRRKALDHILDQSQPVDADGNPVDLTIPDIEEDDEDEDVEESAPVATSSEQSDGDDDSDDEDDDSDEEE